MNTLIVMWWFGIGMVLGLALAAWWDIYFGKRAERYADNRIIEQAQAVCILFGCKIESPLWSHMNGLCDAIKAGGYDISVRPEDCE
jgi:hypothetical protein